MMKKKGKTETEEKESGEEREKTTETRTVHVMWKNSLWGGESQQSDTTTNAKGSISSKRPQVGNTDW